MSLIRRIAFGLICSPAFILPANAEVLKLPEQIPEVVKLADTPHRGMSRNQVLAKFGEPVTRRAAAGNPPVSSWDYGKYSVYFENNFVLHTVVHEADDGEKDSER